MAGELQKLRDSIVSDGVVEEYKHGQNQYGFKETVCVGVYLKMQKNYSATIKQLTDLIPTDSSSEPGQELMNFIRK